MSFETGPTLVEASQWIAKFRGSRVVVKIGGEMFLRPQVIAKIAQQIAVLSLCGIKPIVVHGAGVQVDQECNVRGIEIVKIGGRRVTTPETLDALISVLGRLNTMIGEQIGSHGLAWAGMSDNIHSKVHCTRRPSGEVNWGEVGDLTSVDTSIVDDNVIPVLPSLATAPDGPKNVNGDSTARQAAVSLGAKKLVFLTSTSGVMRTLDDVGPISNMRASDAQSLIESGAASGGMKAKLEESLRALESGVEQVHIISGRDPFGLLRELFTDEGIGTLITRD